MKVLYYAPETPFFSKLYNKLVAFGHAVDFSSTTEETLFLASENKYKVSVFLESLDHKFPGIDICRKLRKLRIFTPLLILSDRRETLVKVRGLDNGADDFLSIPFDFDEFQARVRALSRRYSEIQNDELKVCDLTFNLRTRHVKRGEKQILLRRKESLLLEFLLRNTDNVVSRSQILAQVWDKYEDPITNVVDVHIKQLRNKIEARGQKKLIHTVHGFGYKIGEKKTD